MLQNDVGFTENEVSIKSQGGTEITKRSVAELIPQELSDHFQIIPSRIRDLNEKKIRVLWYHDLAEDPMYNDIRSEDFRAKLHAHVFSSNWQLQEFSTRLDFPLDMKTSVIETPVVPFKYAPKNPNEVNLIYFSTPHRGLELLYPVVDALAKVHPHIHLHVFSSFKIYGWDDADKQFEPLYEKIRQHPNMTYHGFAPQEVLREHIQQAHILAYPSIWKETACRVLIESMSAGLMCVHPNYAALSDTSGGLTSMYQYSTVPNEHAQTFYQYLDNAIQVVNTDPIQQYLRFVKAYADNRFNLDKIAGIWEYRMQQLLEKYPDEAARKFKSRILTFNTGVR